MAKTNFEMMPLEKEIDPKQFNGQILHVHPVILAWNFR